MADIKLCHINHEDTARIPSDTNNLKEENEDLKNRSMRLTLIFRREIGREQSDSWKDVSRYLSEYLANKLGMNLYKVDMQVSRAHHTPKSLL